jgi:hypothetical protein
MVDGFKCSLDSVWSKSIQILCLVFASPSEDLMSNPTLVEHTWLMGLNALLIVYSQNLYRFCVWFSLLLEKI